MGLDTFASRTPGGVKLTEEDEQAFEDAGIELCGGMYSGEGGSFRGKVYDVLVGDVTGVSLYQEWISPEDVGRMADALDAFDIEKVVAHDSRVTPGEVVELRKFFRLCAEQGLGLVGWW